METAAAKHTREVIEAAARVYYITRWAPALLFTVRYQVRNAKTGQPWQAFRHVTAGQVTVLNANRGEWAAATESGYATIEAARAAVAADIAK